MGRVPAPSCSHIERGRPRNNYLVGGRILSAPLRSCPQTYRAACLGLQPPRAATTRRGACSCLVSSKAAPLCRSNVVLLPGHFVASCRSRVAAAAVSRHQPRRRAVIRDRAPWFPPSRSRRRVEAPAAQQRRHPRRASPCQTIVTLCRFQEDTVSSWGPQPLCIRNRVKEPAAQARRHPRCSLAGRPTAYGLFYKAPRPWPQPRRTAVHPPHETPWGTAHGHPPHSLGRSPREHGAQTSPSPRNA